MLLRLLFLTTAPLLTVLPTFRVLLLLLQVLAGVGLPHSPAAFYQHLLTVLHTCWLLLLLQVLAGVGLPHSPGSFYQQLHSYLASLGIDGVKVDVQVGGLHCIGCSHHCKHLLSCNARP
jgi:hypothetical protein